MDFEGKVMNDEEICQHCKQSIILAANGAFVRHNKPGWIDKSKPRSFPVRCPGSYMKPMKKSKGGE